MAVTITGYGPTSDTTPGVTLTAAMPLSGHRVVTTDDNGDMIYASNDDAAHLERRLFLTERAIALGASDEVVAFGEVEEGTWNWTPGEALFLGTNGNLTQTPPAAPAAVFIVEVGRAIDPDRIVFDPKLPIRFAT